MPVVLVYNEEKATDDWDWHDIKGVRHHFPNTYKNMVRPGEAFIYYRGTRRAEGPRGNIEYFGHGIVGDVWLDENSAGVPAAERNWYCSIEDYREFPQPVSAKIGETYRENIAQNRLQNIRVMGQELHDAILAEAFVQPAIPANVNLADQEPNFVADVSDLLLVRREAPGYGRRPGEYPRRSIRAKEIGDKAEAIIMRYLERQGFENVRHVAGAGEKPGWDIEYSLPIGTLQRVEVKGTNLGTFANIEFTANELAAAFEHQQNYWLYLVARCETESPQIAIMQNPAQELQSEPILYRMWNTAN